MCRSWKRDRVNLASVAQSGSSAHQCNVFVINELNSCVWGPHFVSCIWPHSLGAETQPYLPDTSYLISDYVVDAGARLPEFQPWLCHLALWPWMC